MAKIIYNPLSIVIIDGINYELDGTAVNAKVVKNRTKYTGDITIPSSVTYGNFKYKVTNIGEKAFYECEGLTSINIPNGVTCIGDWAFFFCKNLKSVIIPNSVTSIGKNAFCKCRSLTSVDIPDRVTTIGDGAFFGCISLKSVIIPDSVSRIGELSFSCCKGLTSVIIPDWGTSIGNGAFDVPLLRREKWVDEYGVVFSADKTILLKAPKGLKEYIIPDGTKTIGQYAFSDTSETLECVLLPDSVNVIENHAFAPANGVWKKMTSIDIPDGVSFIGGDAFLNVKELKYKGKAAGRPWGAKVDKSYYINRDAKVDKSNHTNLVIGAYEYRGEMLNGKPHGKGGYYDRRSGSPLEEGTYCYGKLVDGYGYTSLGERYPKGGDTWNGYGSGLDSEGNPYTGKWIFGHTEEEFDELWDEIN